MRLFFLFGALLFPGLLSAQVEERVTVVNREIRVHVVGPDGQPVRNLKRDDFALLVDRRRQSIEFFEEIDLGRTEPVSGAEPVPGAAREEIRRKRYLLFIIESYSMDPKAFKNSIQAVREFMTNQWPEDTLIKIVQIEDSLVHITRFTSNREEVLAGLSHIKRKGLLWNKLNILDRGMVRHVGDYIQKPRLRAHAVAMVQNTLRQKAHFKELYYRTFYKNMMVFTGFMKNLPGPKSAFLLTGGSYLEEGGSEFGNTVSLAGKLNAAFNDAGITLYGILAKSPLLPSERALFMHGSGLIPINEFGLTERGLQSMSNFPPNSSPVLAMNTVFENRHQVESGPDHAAGGTGGFLKTSTRYDVFTRELGALYETAGHFYRLAYSRFAEDMADQSKIEIRVPGAGKGWKVRYGKTLAGRKKLSEMDETERNLDFEARLFYGVGLRNDLDCEWKYAVFPGVEDGYRVALYFGMPVADFPPRGYEIGFVAIDETGAVLDATKGHLKQGRSGKAMLVYGLLMPNRLPSAFHFLIRDLSSGETAFHREVVEPERVEPGTGLSPIFLSSDDRLMVPLHRFQEGDDALVRARKEADPFLIGDLLFKPRTNETFRNPDYLGFFFYLFEPRTSSNAFKSRIALEGNGRRLSGKMERVDRPLPGSYRFYGRIETAGLKPGDYRLTVKITDPETGKVYEREIQVQVLGDSG